MFLRKKKKDGGVVRQPQTVRHLTRTTSTSVRDGETQPVTAQLPTKTTSTLAKDGGVVRQPQTARHLTRTTSTLARDGEMLDLTVQHLTRTTSILVKDGGVV